jgi:oxygen-independent coproporphyrinogen-3 oxidase
VQQSLGELAAFEEQGVLERQADGFRVTELGQLFLRNLAMPFDRYLPNQTNAQFSRTV